MGFVKVGGVGKMWVALEKVGLCSANGPARDWVGLRKQQHMIKGWIGGEAPAHQPRVGLDKKENHVKGAPSVQEGQNGRAGVGLC